MTDANPLTLVGLLLTLASLIGSFFYIQLSQWLRDIQAVAAQIEFQAHGDNTEKDNALREAKIEHRKLASKQILITNLSVIAFVVFLIVTGWELIQAARWDPSHPLILRAFLVFGAIFVVMSLGLLIFGLRQLSANAESLGLKTASKPNTPAAIPKTDAGVGEPPSPPGPKTD